MWVPIGIFGGIFVVSVVFWFFLFRTKTVVEEAVFYYHCVGCKRKLKYYARQAASKGMCPRCKQRFIFPATPQPQKR